MLSDFIAILNAIEFGKMNVGELAVESSLFR